jgi:hypothetical protein
MVAVSGSFLAFIIKDCRANKLLPLRGGFLGKNGLFRFFTP